MHLKWNASLAALLLSGAAGLSLWSPAWAEPAKPKRALEAVNANMLRQKLAKLRGKVVVLNLWATWCGPCVHEFPDLVKLDRAYRSKGVVVIGLSMDDPKQAQKLVPPFLAKQKATFPVYVMKPVDPTSVIGVFDKFWRGSIPVTYFFDRKGRLQTRLEGGRTLYAFEQALRPLLGSSHQALEAVQGSGFTIHG